MYMLERFEKIWQVIISYSRCTNATRDTTDAAPQSQKSTTDVAPQSQKKPRTTEKVDIVGPWTGLNPETHKIY